MRDKHQSLHRLTFIYLGKCVLDENILHLSCSQGDEVLCGLWDSFSEQTDHDASHVLIPNPHIKVHLRKQQLQV